MIMFGFHRFAISHKGHRPSESLLCLINTFGRDKGLIYKIAPENRCIKHIS